MENHDDDDNKVLDIHVDNDHGKYLENLDDDDDKTFENLDDDKALEYLDDDDNTFENLDDDDDKASIILKNKHPVEVGGVHCEGRDNAQCSVV